MPDIQKMITDKKFHSYRQRQTCQHQVAKPAIPFKTNHTAPHPLNKKTYRERNHIEPLLHKLKKFHHVPTRYQKLKPTFLPIIHLALAFIRLNELSWISSDNASPGGPPYFC